MKDFIRLAGTLCAITFIAAALLGGVNELTEDRIASAREEKRQSAMRALIPEAESFETFDGHDDIFMGLDADGRAVGFCLNTTSSGYGGDIEMMVGINDELKLAGIEILSNSETPGLGANCTKPDFKEQFAGLTVPVTVVKGGGANGENEVNAITGATITSRAVVKGVDDACEYLNQVLTEYIQSQGGAEQ